MTEPTRDIPYWLIGGRLLPVIAGGSEGPAGDGGGGGEGDGGEAEGEETPAPAARAKPKGKKEADGMADPAADWFQSLPAEGQQYLRELRRSAAGNSKKAREAQAALDNIQRATMSTEQQLQVELERERSARSRAQEQLRTEFLQGALSREGGTQGAIYPNDLWRNVDPEDIQWDAETGKVLNAPELVAGLRTNFPRLFEERRPSAGVDAGRRTAPKPRGPDPDEMMNQVIRMRRG